MKDWKSWKRKIEMKREEKKVRNGKKTRRSTDVQDKKEAEDFGAKRAVRVRVKGNTPRTRK